MSCVPARCLLVCIGDATQHRFTHPTASELDAVRKTVCGEPRGQTDSRRSRQVHRSGEIHCARRSLAPRRVKGGERAGLDGSRNAPCGSAAGWTRHRVDRVENRGKLRAQCRSRLPRLGDVLGFELGPRLEKCAHIRPVVRRTRGYVAACDCTISAAAMVRHVSRSNERSGMRTSTICAPWEANTRRASSSAAASP